jgi:WD40 repeat protein
MFSKNFIRSLLFVSLTVGLLIACSPKAEPAAPEVPTIAPEAEIEPTPAWKPALLQSLEHEEAVSSVDYSPDGKIVASGLFPKVNLWDAVDGSLIASFEHRHSVDSLEFSPDGQLLGAGQATDGVRLSQLSDGTEFQKLGRGYDSRMSFSPDGLTVATGNREGVVWIWSVASGELVAELEAPEADYITDLLFSPDGAFLAAGHFDCLINLWQVSDGSLLHTFERNNVACTNSGLAFSPDSRFLTGAGARQEYEDVVKIWGLADQGLVAEIPLTSESMDVAFSPDGKFLAVGAREETSLWSVEDFSLVTTLDQEFPAGGLSRVTGLAFSPDSTVLAVGRYDGSLELWQVAPAQ